MNYTICDKISWKESLLLLKNDISAQRVYSTLWSMTKDVLRLSLSLSAACSLVLLVPTLISPIGTWWETICVVVFVPLSFILPFTWIGAYFGWYKSLKKMESIMFNLVSSLSGVDCLAQIRPASYNFRYEHRQFHFVFQEMPVPGKPVSVAQGKLIMALAYEDPKKRGFEALCNEIANYLEGKQVDFIAISNHALMCQYESKSLPSAQELTDGMNLMLYLAQRFNLDLTPEEVVYGMAE